MKRPRVFYDMLAVAHVMESLNGDVDIAFMLADAMNGIVSYAAELYQRRGEAVLGIPPGAPDEKDAFVEWALESCALGSPGPALKRLHAMIENALEAQVAARGAGDAARVLS